MTNANVTFASLPSANTLDGSEVFPLDQGGVTKQARTSALIQFSSTLTPASFGKPIAFVNDTNVTATLAGLSSITLFSSLQVTLGWTGTLSATRLDQTGTYNWSGNQTWSASASFTAPIAFSTTVTINNLTVSSAATVSASATLGSLAVSSASIIGASLTVNSLLVSSRAVISIGASISGGLSVATGGAIIDTGGIQISSLGSGVLLTNSVGGFFPSIRTVSGHYTLLNAPSTTAGSSLGTTFFQARDADNGASDANWGYLNNDTLQITNRANNTNFTKISSQGLQFQSGGLIGSTTNDSALTGNVGELQTVALSTASAVTLVSNTVANITSLSLSPGDWDVTGVAIFTGGTTTTVNFTVGALSTTSSAIINGPTSFQESIQCQFGSVPFNLISQIDQYIGPARFSLSGTTTINLVAQAVFGTSQCQASGAIRARRIR